MWDSHQIERLRALARDLDAVGAECVRRAMVLGSQAAAVRWESTAAAAMRERAEDAAHRLQQFAAACHVAAECVSRHALRLQVRQVEQRTGHPVFGPPG